MIIIDTIINRNVENKTRLVMIDVLKGISIIAVVLYHALGDDFGTGYLGVDVFFVVNGFLVIPSVCNSVQKGDFRYFRWLFQKIIRLLPLLFIVCVVAFCIGMWSLFPDNLLTLSESVIASFLFSNNLLSLFLCADYWDWTNEFKPLMHTWYLGVLIELYIVIPIIIMGIKSLMCNKNDSYNGAKKKISYGMGIIAIISIIAFFINKKPETNFYIFIFRMYESVVGGLLGMYIKEIKNYFATKRISNKYINLLKWGAIILCSITLSLGMCFGKVTNVLFTNKILIPLCIFRSNGKLIPLETVNSFPTIR